MSYFSVVFQDVFLFNDTVSANIKLGRPQATEEEVITAAKSANCDGFIQKLTDGYQTMVSDFGGNLSGGEKQRISIARAILKDAPIVILDEPTAALDTENELAVQKAIASLVKDRTILVIAHRLSTIRGADSILVVKDAAIAERGSHAELVAKKGIYFSMCEAQSHNLEWKI
jgi:ATP-binding cassette subfamily B protein